MKILICAPFSLSKEVGTSKVFIEFAESLSQLGWDCDLKGPLDINSSLSEYDQNTHRYRIEYSKQLRAYLKQNASKYDIVDYDREMLPYPRSEFAASPLFVARSALLLHHLEYHSIPVGSRLRNKIGHLLKSKSRRQILMDRINRSTVTIQSADLVNVSTDDDCKELEGRGVSPDKLIAMLTGKKSIFCCIQNDRGM